MKQKTIFIRLFSLLLLLSLLLSVNDTAAAKSSIALNKKSLSLKVSQTATLKLKGVGKKKVTWSSSNKKIATVKNGIVKAKAVGSCTVTAKYAGKKYKCSVRVTARNIQEEPKLLLEQDNLHLTLSIQNPTDITYYTGRDFGLQKLENGEWQTVPMREDIAFTAEALIVSPGTYQIESLSLDFYFENLTAGSYRISKTLFSENGNLVIYAEFELGQEEPRLLLEQNGRELTMSIENPSGVTYLAGMDFELQKLENGEWQEFPMRGDAVFPSIALIISHGTNYIQSIELDSYFDNLTAGSYRISTILYGGEGNNPLTIYAEFELA